MAYEQAKSIKQVVEQYGQNNKQSMVEVNVHLIAERKPCHPHLCYTLQKFVSEYKKELAEDNSLATNALGVAYLKFLNYIRTNSANIKRKEVLKLLQKYHQSINNDGNVYITLMDTIAGSRHGEAMLAALDFLDLTKCKEDKVFDCERFLVTISVSAATSANMGNSYVAEHSLSNEQLLDLFVPLIKSSSWADNRVKHSFALSLATMIHSYRLFTDNSIHSAQPHYSSLYMDTTLVPHHSSLSDMIIDISSDETTEMHHAKQRKPTNRFSILSVRIWFF